jgi:hypothetical protein
MKKFKKLDPRDFEFIDKTGETLTKNAPQINGQQFILQNLTSCTVQLFDFLDSIVMDDCNKSTFLIGPLSNSIIVTNCKDCTIIVAAKQVRLNFCENIKLYIYSSTDPALQGSKKITIAPYNLVLPNLRELIEKAELNIAHNRWNKIHDFTKASPPNWNLLGQSEFHVISESISNVVDVGEAIIPIHVMYGGNAEDMVDDEDDSKGMEMATTKEEAEEQRKRLENQPINTDKNEKDEFDFMFEAKDNETKQVKKESAPKQETATNYALFEAMEKPETEENKVIDANAAGEVVKENSENDEFKFANSSKQPSIKKQEEAPVYEEYV